MTTLERIAELWPIDLSQPSPIEIPNVGREDLAYLFNALHFVRGVEVGTERGLYAETLCKANKPLHLTCVDPWMPYHGYREHTSKEKLNDFYEEAQQRLAPYNCSLLRLFSTAAAPSFKDDSLDFVYVDGNHSLLHVIQDLHAWVPKVRRGGIVAGHDFIRRKRTAYLMHVPAALAAYTEAYAIKPWFILGRKAIMDGEVRDTPRSWLWVKE